MEKGTAKKIIELAVSIDHILGDMFLCVNQIHDEDTKNEFDKSVGDLMGYISRDLILPLVNRYPDLNPDI